MAPRFGNYLKNNCLAQAHQLDLAVIELATKAIARLTQVSGMYTANLKFDFIDHEVKKAFEWLSAPERNEGRRHAAVMVLREIAYCMPTFFFQVICPNNQIMKSYFINLVCAECAAVL